MEWSDKAMDIAGLPEGSRAFFAVLEEMGTLHVSKSHDYGSNEDPLANIRHGADIVNIEPWRACLVRIADKVQRLRSFCKNGRLVHEGVEDTLKDLACYAALALVFYRDQQRPKNQP